MTGTDTKRKCSPPTNRWRRRSSASLIRRKTSCRCARARPMGDPAVDAAAAEAAKKHAAINEAEQFLRARRQWLDVTPYDWSDADKRADIHTRRLGYPMRFWFASGRHLGLPDRPTIVEISLPPEQIWPMSDAERGLILKRLVKPEPLPRGRGRHQAVPISPAMSPSCRRSSASIGDMVFPRSAANKKPKKTPPPAIVRIALQRLGVTLRKRTIDGIWRNRAL